MYFVKQYTREKVKSNLQLNSRARNTHSREIAIRNREKTDFGHKTNIKNFLKKNYKNYKCCLPLTKKWEIFFPNVIARAPCGGKKYVERCCS